MMIFNYISKKLLAAQIGQPLDYTETSMFGDEYSPNGTFCGSNRPFTVKGNGTREFFAEVTMKNGLIAKVK